MLSRSHNSNCEQEAKFVQERIAGVEKHFAELCSAFAAFTRKAARLRDKNDELAKVIQTYAESEIINRSVSHSLMNFSTTLSVIGDYKNAEAQRLEAKVIAPLSQYSSNCKNAREDVKTIFNARDKQLSKKIHLDQICGRDLRDRQMISQANLDVMKATAEVTRVVKELEEKIDTFEKHKLHNLKTILIDFTKIELAFHTKAVELLTKAYQDIAEIDEAKDLEDYQLARGKFNAKFREVLNGPDANSRLDVVRRTSFRQSYSLSNLANRISSSPLLNIKKFSSRKSNSLDSMKMGELKNSSESVEVEEYNNEDNNGDDDNVDDDEDDEDEDNNDNDDDDDDDDDDVDDIDDVDEDDNDDEHDDNNDDEDDNDNDNIDDEDDVGENDINSDSTEISSSIKEKPINKSGKKNYSKCQDNFILKPVPPITRFRQALAYSVIRKVVVK